MKLVDRIASRYKDFTTNEKRIFNLMNEDIKGFSLCSIGEIAHSLDISKTTLMRFAKSCGFKGYADFRRELQREVLLNISPVRKMKEVISSEYNLSLEEICEQEHANIETTFSALEAAELDRLADLIIEKREIYTLSWGISGTIADIFTLRMKLMGIRCTPIKRNHGTLIEETSLLKKDDLVLVFEIPPYNNEIIETAARLNERNIRLVVITDSPKCPVTEFSDLNFFCTTNAMFFGNSLTGHLFWVNLVSSFIMYRNKDKVMDILDETQKFFNDERYYHQ